jgi:hypothetical protein
MVKTNWIIKSFEWQRCVPDMILHTLYILNHIILTGILSSYCYPLCTDEETIVTELVNIIGNVAPNYCLR